MLFKGKKFIFFCGKGGVGKTTCAASTAVKLSQSGYKTLLYSTDPAHSIADSLGQSLTNKISEIRHVSNLYAVEINASIELKSFIDKYQKEISGFFITVTGLDMDDMDDLLLLTLPGLDELMAVKKIVDFLESENNFDYIVCDTAPTGHALRLISVPDIVNDWVKVLAGIQWEYKYFTGRLINNAVQQNDFLFIIKRIINSAKLVFRNSAQTIFNVVTIPEAMAIAETMKLISSLNKMGIMVRNLIINNIIPENNQCAFCTNYRKSQNIYIEELKRSFSNIHIIIKLRHSSEIRGVPSLIDFAEDLNLSGVPGNNNFMNETGEV